MLFVGSVSASDNLYDGKYGRPSFFPSFTDPTAYANNMIYKVVVADANGQALTNYEVAVYDQDNELRAIGRSNVNSGDFCKLTISGVEGDTFRFEVLYGDIVRPTVKKISQTCQFRTNASVGYDGTPFTLTIDESGKPANVCYTLSNVPAGSYRTICLPYAVDCTGGTAYEISGLISGQGISLNAVQTMQAGKPYFIKATSTGDVDFVFHNIARGATTKVATPVTDNNGLVGTFVDNGNVPYDAYILSSNQLYRVDRSLAFKANRAYVDLSLITQTTSEAHALVLSFTDAEETAILSTASAQESRTYYDLRGTVSRPAQSGIRIVRTASGAARKVIIKK